MAERRQEFVLEPALLLRRRTRPLLAGQQSLALLRGLALGSHVAAHPDHLFDAAVVDRLLDSFNSDFLNIGVDQKLDSIFDLEDAMKVRTRGNRVTDIGKKLSDYDAIDIGLFVCPLEIFDYFERAKSRSGKNDCSLADGVRLMAGNDKVRAIDIGDGWWQDVDTPSMLQHAERKMSASYELNPR